LLKLQRTANANGKERDRRWKRKKKEKRSGELAVAKRRKQSKLETISRIHRGVQPARKLVEMWLQ
jgi:hypothetical protein